MTESEIVEIIRSILAPAHFIVFSPLQLKWDESDREELVWEIYQGRLLGASMTRERRTFRAWNVSSITAGKSNEEPFVSIKRDLGDGQLYVTRSLLCYGHRVISTGNVIESREDVIWSRELVGVLDPRQFTSEPLTKELGHLVFSAIVGTSQLPLTSLEAPLPDFVLGRLGYVLNAMDFGYAPASTRYDVKYLELLLRSATPIEEIATRSDAAHALAMLREAFLGVSLSPYSDFVSRSLALLRELETRRQITLDQRIDFIGWLIRLQWRHLNAYDLFLFHHRGANYPDALLVDEALRELLDCVASQPSAFKGEAARLRRRALRWGWFLRNIYTGHRVPRHPTSPGENSRVLPAPWVHLGEEEILNPHRRSTELFREPLSLTDETENLLKTSIEELADDIELRELGTALILDRPLGWSKSVGEPDLTPALAYVARSKKLAVRHIEHLEKHGTPFFPPQFAQGIRRRLALIELPGVPMPHLRRPARPGVLSLTDAFQTSDDFIVDRTTSRSLENFRHQFDWSDVNAALTAAQTWRLVLPTTLADHEVLEVFGEQLVPWLRLEVDASDGFRTRCGVEVPIGGMQATMLPTGNTHKVMPR